MPVFAGPGAELAAGEVNLTGVLTLKVMRTHQESALQRVSRLVEIAETARNKYTSLADQAAALYAPGVHLLAFVAFLVWLIIAGDLRLALNIAIATLIITCPCALGLAVPAVTTAASGALFRKGVLLKSATALERLAEVDVAVFDKTGTLTLGQPVLENAPDLSPVQRSLALSLANGSAHPLARAIVDAFSDHEPASLDQLVEHPGLGIEAIWCGQPVRLGRASWMGQDAGTTTATWLQIADEPPVALTFSDHLRPGAKALISDLQKSGITCHLLSGDAEAPAKKVARKLGIAKVMSGVLPEEKLDCVKALGATGHKVLMIGDGLNDTSALACAYVSASPASAIDAARVASDIVVLGKDISVLADALHTARSARKRIKENFALAALYNLIAVPIAVLGFATPLMAALAMSTSSVTVTLNAWRVK